jgi:hypothetical protein
MNIKGMRDLEARESFQTYVIVFLFVGLLIIAGYFIRESNKSRQAEVVDSKDAGQLVNVSFIPHTLSRDNTMIETNKGTYLIYGKPQAEKGAGFRLERRLNKQQFLCADSSNECWKLVF